MKAKNAPLEEGSIYAERWLAGARTLEEVAPSVADWVRQRARRRARLIRWVLVAAMTYVGLLMGWKALI